jgi:hypothetical protein
LRCACVLLVIVGEFRSRLEVHMHVECADLYVVYVCFSSILDQVARLAGPYSSRWCRTTAAWHTPGLNSGLAHAGTWGRARTQVPART